MTEKYVGYHMSHKYGQFSQQVFHSNNDLKLGDRLIVISGDKPTKTQYFLEGEFEIVKIDDDDKFKLGTKSFKYRFKLAYVSIPPKPIYLNLTEIYKDIHPFYSNGKGITILRREHHSFINALLDEYTESLISIEIENLYFEEEILVTERKQLIDARLGQGKFRQETLKLWDYACAVTGLSIPALLVASHIKPWSLSNNKERLSADNGIILAAHLDKAFDQFLITFKDDGAISIN